MLQIPAEGGDGERGRYAALDNHATRVVYGAKALGPEISGDATEPFGAGSESTGGYPDEQPDIPAAGQPGQLGQPVSEPAQLVPHVAARIRRRGHPQLRCSHGLGQVEQPLKLAGLPGNRPIALGTQANYRQPVVVGKLPQFRRPGGAGLLPVSLALSGCPLDAVQPGGGGLGAERRRRQPRPGGTQQSHSAAAASSR